MRTWQFFMLASFIYGAPRVTQGVGVAMQLFWLVVAVIAIFVEWRNR